jgi:hypothetical protein
MNPENRISTAAELCTQLLVGLISLVLMFLVGIIIAAIF